MFNVKEEIVYDGHATSIDKLQQKHSIWFRNIFKGYHLKFKMLSLSYGGIRNFFFEKLCCAHEILMFRISFINKMRLWNKNAPDDGKFQIWRKILSQQTLMNMKALIFKILIMKLWRCLKVGRMSRSKG